MILILLGLILRRLENESPLPSSDYADCARNIINLYFAAHDVCGAAAMSKSRYFGDLLLRINLWVFKTKEGDEVETRKCTNTSRLAISHSVAIYIIEINTYSYINTALFAASVNFVAHEQQTEREF